MPRQAREKSSSGIYHIMIRGINRQNLFEENADRRRFIEILHHYKTISKYMIYGYCLMDNHVHLLIQEMEEPISNAIKRISSSYVYWFNKKYQRLGHLFQERFKSEAVETDEYFLTVLRYIHQNPIKAAIVKNIGKYEWSSYREYMGTPVITDIEYALDLYATDRVKALEIFKKYSNEQNTDQCLEYHEKTSVTDQELLEHLKRYGIVSISEIQKLEKAKRDDIIKKMKRIEGVTIRQLSRITGISKSVIDRI